MKIRTKLKKNLRIISSGPTSHFPMFESIGMIQKQGNWVRYGLKPRELKKHFFTYEQLLRRKKRKGFCMPLSLVMKSEFGTTTPSEENHMVTPDRHQYWRQSKFKDWSLCSAFDRIRRASCTISFSIRTKPSSVIKNNELESSVQDKTSRIFQKTWHGDFSTW